PAMRQFFRCSGVASNKRGYHAKGTVMVRPSTRSTLKLSSSVRTSFTRSPGLIPEVFMPCPQKLLLVIRNHSPDFTKLLCCEAQIACQRHRIEPEFRRFFVTVHVHMRRFAAIVAHEVYTVRPNDGDGGHRASETIQRHKRLACAA